MVWTSVDRWCYYWFSKPGLDLDLKGFKYKHRVKSLVKQWDTQFLEMTEITECQKQPLQKPQVSKNCQDFVMLNAGTNNPFHQLLILGCYQPVVAPCGLALCFLLKKQQRTLRLKRENPCASLKISFLICLARKYCKFLSEFTTMYRLIESMAIKYRETFSLLY